MPLKVMVFNVAVTYMPEGHIYADTDEGITDADVFVTTADLPPWAQPQQRTDVTERSSERVAPNDWPRGFNGRPRGNASRPRPSCGARYGAALTSWSARPRGDRV